MNPKISVIVPVYNTSKYIERCLSSILSQSFSNFELLLINDGSVDDSLQICKQFAEKDKRIRLFDRLNCGVSATRQFGIDHCIGKYCIQIDSDDWIDADYFKVLVEKAETDDADVVIAPFIKEYPDRIEKPKMFQSDSVHEYINGMLRGRCWGFVWNKLIRSALFKETSAKFPNGVCMWEDYVFIVECMLFARQIAFVDHVYYHYVQYNANSLCATSGEYDMLSHIIYAIEDLDVFVRTYGKYDKYKKNLAITKHYAKQKLLFDSRFRNLKKWYSVFPESNASFFYFIFRAIYNKLFPCY